MAWLRISDKFYDDPDVLELGNEAAGAFVRLLSYCAYRGTDGFVPLDVAKTISRRSVLGRLENAGLLRGVVGGELHEVTGRRDSGRRALEDVLVRCPGPGYFVPKFLHYNLSTGERFRVPRARNGAR